MHVVLRYKSLRYYFMFVIVCQYLVSVSARVQYLAADRSGVCLLCNSLVTINSFPLSHLKFLTNFDVCLSQFCLIFVTTKLSGTLPPSSCVGIAMLLCVSLEQLSPVSSLLL